MVEHVLRGAFGAGSTVGAAGGDADATGVALASADAGGGGAVATAGGAGGADEHPATSHTIAARRERADEELATAG